MLLLIGFLDDRKKSISPAENPNPAYALSCAAKNTDIPVSRACTKYNCGAANINANSSGSVTPVRNDAKAPAIIRALIVFLFLASVF